MLNTTIAGKRHRIIIDTLDASDYAGHNEVVMRLHAALADLGEFNGSASASETNADASESVSAPALAAVDLDGGSVVRGAQGWFHDLRTEEQKARDAREAVFGPAIGNVEFPAEPGVYTMATDKDRVAVPQRDPLTVEVDFNPDRFLGVIVGRDNADRDLPENVVPTPDSEATLAVGYDGQRSVFSVIYGDGDRYDYENVVPSVWSNFRREMDCKGSVGRFVNRFVKYDANGRLRRFRKQGRMGL